MKNKILITAFMLLFISGIALIVFAEIGSESYRINTSVFSSGGDIMGSENFLLTSTMGQSSPLMPQEELVITDSYTITPGFWHIFDIEGSEIITFEMHLPAGWSLISLPVHPEVALGSELFPSATVIYDYVPDLGYRRVTGNMEIGKGYWIFVNEAKTFTLTGQSIFNYTFLIDKEGWQIIGGCTSNAKVSSVNCNIEVIYQSIHRIGYKRIPISEGLKPCNGYWILLKQVEIPAKIIVQNIAPDL